MSTEAVGPRALAIGGLLLVLACSDGSAPNPDPGPQPHANGRLVYSTSDEDPEGWRQKIYSVEPDGSARLELTAEFATVDVLPTPFGQATRAPFYRFVPEAEAQYFYYAVNGDGSSLTGPFQFDFWHYDVSLDGTRIAGHVETADGWRIGVGSLLTGEVVYVSTDTLIPYEPFLSPTGDAVGFQGRTDDNAQADLYIVRTDGTGWTRLTDDAFYENGAKWSPDGRYIVYARSAGNTGHMYAVAVDGSGQRDLYPRPCDSWSLGSLSGRTKLICGDEELFIIDLESGEVQPTGLDENCAALSPDETRVLCVDENGIQTVRLDGSDRITITPVRPTAWVVWLTAEQ